MRKIAIGAAVGFVVVFGLVIFGLYLLGDEDQSALERLRDISIILIVLLFLVNVILLGVVTVVLAFLAIQVKDRVIPILEEVTGTAKQVRGTVTFASEEAVRPLIGVAGGVARMREMSRVVTGRTRKIPKPKSDPHVVKPTKTGPTGQG